MVRTTEHRVCLSGDWSLSLSVPGLPPFQKLDVPETSRDLGRCVISPVQGEGSRVKGRGERVEGRWRLINGRSTTRDMILPHLFHLGSF